MGSFSRSSLGFVTAMTMAVATFPQVVFSVLAADLIAEFGVHRWQIGALVFATAMTAAVMSPFFGSLTDRLGAVRSTRGVLVSTIVTLSLLAGSPNYVLIVLAAFISGAPQGWSNPATNGLIVDNLQPGARGVVTGIKQAGVQVGIFLGGVVLPAIAALTTWRLAISCFLVIPVVGLLGIGRQSGHRGHHSAEDMNANLPGFIKWISLYGLLSGAGTSAMLTFIPLFAQEDQMWSELHAGWLIAGVGLVGIAARILWGPISQSWLGHGRTMRVLAGLSAVGAALLGLAAAGAAPSWVMVLSGLLLGVGGISWNTVGMLAIMDYSPIELVGRGTGRVLFGFLFGYGIGAPLMGLSVDSFGGYTPGWIAVVVLFLMATVIAGRVHRTGLERTPQSSVP